MKWKSRRENNKPEALSIEPKLLKIWKQRQMVQKFPKKVSRNSGNCWISEIRSFQLKILEISGAKLNGKKTSGKKFGYTLWGCPFFWKLWRQKAMTSLGSMYFPQINQRRFALNQNFWKFGNSGKWYRNFPKKFPEIPETVEFPKYDPFNRKF